MQFNTFTSYFWHFLRKAKRNSFKVLKAMKTKFNMQENFNLLGTFESKKLNAEEP